MRLKGTRPQMSGQLELPLEARDEIPHGQRSGEVPMAARATESSGRSDLMERVVSRTNLQNALKRVKSNKGSPGIDGMTVDELSGHLREHWEEIREQLLAGTYQPRMVKQQLIPKSGGGMRELGIPTVLDRFIQQALLTGTAVGSRQGVLPAQLRLPARTECARGSMRGAALRPARSPLGGGRGSGEVLRPRQSRCADGETRQAR